VNTKIVCHFRVLILKNIFTNAEKNLGISSPFNLLEYLINVGKEFRGYLVTAFQTILEIRGFDSGKSLDQFGETCFSLTIGPIEVVTSTIRHIVNICNLLAIPIQNGVETYPLTSLKGFLDLKGKLTNEGFH